MTRLNETCALSESGAVEFSSVTGRANRIDVAWSRDGTTAPGPGVGGALSVFRVDALSRQLVARTEDGRRFLVEIPLDDVDPEALPAVWGELRNTILDEIWRNRAVASSSLERAPVSLGLDLHPPLFICNEKGVVFHPPWPGDGPEGPLEVCRDTDVLALAGLPPHAHTHQRYLHNPAASRVGPGAVLYSAAPDAPASGGGRVRSRDAFVIDLASRVATTPGSGPRHSDFPCAGCPESAHCYPPAAAGPNRAALAPQRVDPVAFYPFRVVARPVDVLSRGEHADLLGGATWRPFRTRHVRQWDQPGRARAREDLQATTFADVGATTPLAALAKKVPLFESVVRAVLRFHEDFGQPHLGLSADNVVSLSAAALPDGTYDVDLQGELRCAPLRDDVTAPPGAPIWLPPPELTAPYAARDLLAAGRLRRELIGGAADEFAYGKAFPARMTVGRIWGGQPSSEPAQFELQLATGCLARVDLDPGDLVRLEIRSVGWERVVLWCSPDTERPIQAGSPAFRANSVVLDSGQRHDLDAAAAGGALFVEATVHRTYGAWYDVHALGMLLLRLVLDNSNQSFEDVVRDVLPALSSIARSSRVRNATDPWAEFVEGVRNAVTTPPLDRFLASGNICFFGSEIGTAGDDVPDVLWAELLAIAIGAVSFGECVSFAATTRLERDRTAFTAPLKSLLQRVESLRQKMPQPAAEAPPVLMDMDDAWADDESAPSFDAAPAMQPSAPVGAVAVDAADPAETEELRREVKRLKEALTGQAAKLARLESEREDVERVRAEALSRPARDSRTEGAVAAWDALLTALAGTSSHGLPPPAPGEPAFELVRAVAADGLETIAGLLAAAAELGGQEFALQQSSVARRVRRALLSGDPAELRAAGGALDDARRQLGGLIAALVDAHAESTREGTRIALATLQVGMQRELGLGRKETAKLEKLVERMKDRVGDLCAKVYDPTFQKAVRSHIRSAAKRGGRTT